MNDQQEIAGKRQEDVFCTPLRIHNRTVLDQGCKFLRGWITDRGRLEDLDSLNGPPDHGFSQIAYNDLNLGYFSHGWR